MSERIINMAEFPSPFCPKDCLFNGVPRMCDTDCVHSRDIIYDNPRTIETKWAGQWVKTQIIDESIGNYYIVIEGKGGVFTISKESELIK